MNMHPNDKRWQVAALRMTAFPSPGAQTSNQDWWINVVGAPPDERIEHPRTSERQELIEYENGQLLLQTQLISINWVYQIVDDPLQEFGKIKTLGNLSDTLQSFLKLINSWFALETVPPLTRLAFGAILLQSVDNGSEGYRDLASYLPYIKIDPVNSSDFFYQINRRRGSKLGIKNLKINRLTKWSVMKAQFGLGALGAPSQLSEAFAVRLELDINTAPEIDGELNREQLSDIFDELVSLGLEIAEKGDIP